MAAATPSPSLCIGGGNGEIVTHDGGRTWAHRNAAMGVSRRAQVDTPALDDDATGTD
jgi:hypothetical protein